MVQIVLQTKRCCVRVQPEAYLDLYNIQNQNLLIFQRGLLTINEDINRRCFEFFHFFIIICFLLVDVIFIDTIISSDMFSTDVGEI